MTRGDILPAQTDNSGKYLTTDGTTLSWDSVDSLPSQAGNSGKYLTTDGTDPSWATAASAAAGSDTQVQFNDGGTSFGGDAGLAYNKTTGKLTVGGKTVTTSNPVLDASQTWNAAGVTFTALKVNATNTASAAGSLLMDLQVGGASQMAIGSGGAINLVNGSMIIRPNVSGANEVRFLNNGLVFRSVTETLVARFVASTGQEGLSVVSSGQISFASGIPTNSVGDTVLRRDAADTLAQRRTTNAQTFRVYNTFTDASNYERGFMRWNSNVMEFGTEEAGTGTARALRLQTDGTTALTLTTAQKAEFAQTIKTAAPAGGTAAEWKLGTVATVTPTLANRTIEVDIGGTIYYLHAKTTND
jgi:hypothetical protein